MRKLLGISILFWRIPLKVDDLCLDKCVSNRKSDNDIIFDTKSRKSWKKKSRCGA